MSDGCTIGALSVKGKRFLFKNRDLTYLGFKDAARFEDDLFFVTGVDIATGNPSGASLGFNKHGLMAASSTVLITEDLPYDNLLESVLRKAASVDEAIAIVQDDVDGGFDYQWCNFVLSDEHSVGAIEVGPKEIASSIDEEIIVRTNHHLELSTNERVESASLEMREAAGPLSTSQSRLDLAISLMSGVENLKGIKKMLSSHSEGRGFDSICRHRDSDGAKFRGRTAYSYIMEISPQDEANGFRIHVARGTPCDSKYEDIEIDFKNPSRAREQIVVNFP